MPVLLKNDLVALNTKMRAYMASNENIRKIIQLTSGLSDVLTVAASGDQALFYKISGVSHLDTYDISPFARVIQDIKTTAIKNMPYNEYISFINRIFWQINTNRRQQNLISDLGIIYKQLPSESKALVPYLHSAVNKPDKNPENYPTEQEYKKLSESLKGPFNFILSDLANLHEKTEHKYDVINVSNIFDFFANPICIYKTTANLINNLNPNGYIVYIPQNNTIQITDFNQWANQQNIPLTARTEKIPDSKTSLILIQHTR